MSSVTTTFDHFQPPPPAVRRFTVAEYHRMIQDGILSEKDQVELLNGWIVPKMSRKPPHDAVIDIAQELVGKKLPPSWRLRLQSAITTADSEPEPDLALVRGPAQRYLQRHPVPEEIAKVIEVSDSTLQRDRQDKGPLYARAGIPIYWIINLVDRVVEVFSEPDSTGKYQNKIVKTLDEQVDVIVDGKNLGSVSVRELLGD